MSVCEGCQSTGPQAGWVNDKSSSWQCWRLAFEVQVWAELLPPQASLLAREGCLLLAFTCLFCVCSDLSPHKDTSPTG